MTAVDLDAIQARIDAATPGPWESDGDYPRAEVSQTEGDWETIVGTEEVGHGHMSYTRLVLAAADSQFIAHARTDVVDMAAEIRELRSKDAHHANLTSYLEDEVAALRALLAARSSTPASRPPFKRAGRLRLRLPADHRNHVHFALPPGETVYIEAWGQHVDADTNPSPAQLDVIRYWARELREMSNLK